MTRTPLGPHLFIEADPARWRLVAPAAVTRAGDLTLIDAAPGDPLRYLTAFGISRRLPGENLPLAHIQRIVVGWSRRDEAWHLGVLLTPDAATAREGIRWVEIGAWPGTPTPSNGATATASMSAATLPEPGADAQNHATRAGEALAGVLGVPFSLVPPRDDSSIITPVMPPPAPVVQRAYTPPAPAPLAVPGFVPAAPAAPVLPYTPAVSVAPVAPEPLPRPLPIGVDKWTLAALSPTVLELRLTRSPMRGAVLRLMWYLLWALAFVALSVSSLTSGIAFPQPEWLPYAGFVAAAFLVINGIVGVVRAGRRIDRIIADADRREILGLRGESPRWVLPAPAIESLYVSERVSKARRGKPDRAIHDGEINFLMHDGKFWHGIVFSALDEKVLFAVPPADADAVTALNESAVVPLDGHNALSSLRQIGLHVSRSMQIGAFYDQRIR